MNAPEKINKLKAAMHGMAGLPEPTPEAVPPPVPSRPLPPTTRAPSRVGKRNVSAYINATAAKQLRLLAVELDRSTQGLVEEALNDLFRKHGRSAIA